MFKKKKKGHHKERRDKIFKDTGHVSNKPTSASGGGGYKDKNCQLKIRK